MPIPTENKFPCQTLVACLLWTVFADALCLQSDCFRSGCRGSRRVLPPPYARDSVGVRDAGLAADVGLWSAGAHSCRRPQSGRAFCGWQSGHTPAFDLESGRQRRGRWGRGGGVTGKAGDPGGGHQGQTSREGERDMWWTAGTTRGGAGHLGLTHTETQRGRLWTACGQRCVDSKNSQTTPATTSTTPNTPIIGRR